MTLTLVVLVHLLLLLMLLRLAPPVSPPPSERVPTVFDLASEGEGARPTEAPRRRERRARAAAGREAARPAPPVPTEAKPTAPVDTSVWSKVLPLSRSELAQADISGLPRRAGGEGSQVAQTGTADGDDQAVGRAPNGEKLYAADWYRRPTGAELSPYMPRTGVRTGWGEIACRMVADYRVEDCQELGQSPPGSGFARAVRQAAWQFRVRPPRLGGKPLTGVWVRIRIDYTERGAG